MIKKENNEKMKDGVTKDVKEAVSKKDKNRKTMKKNRRLMSVEKTQERTLELKSFCAETPPTTKSAGESTLDRRSSQTPTKKVEDDFKHIGDIVVAFPFYHGFICRQDLSTLLKTFGDFLIRVSIHDEKSGDEKKLMANKAGGRRTTPVKVKPVLNVQKHFVISTFTRDAQTTEKGSAKRSNPVVNLIIRRTEDKYCIEVTKKFKTIPDLIAGYQKEPGIYRGKEFSLLNGIGLSNWEFKHEDVKILEKKLGEGAFGEVRIGEISIGNKPVQVAVKKLKDSEHLNREKVVELCTEGRIMRMLNHRNVLRCYGLAVLTEPLYLVSELCENGALREYLRRNAKNVTGEDRLNFCLGSAKGVEYLHTQNLIHRDLAVRNVLLTENKTPKVADFGLSKLTDRYEMKETCKIPVRYLAPETLENFVFTSKSDVYSFGIVIWEIYENGQQPHDGQNAQTIKELTKKQCFLKIKETAPELLRTFVTEKIFVIDPENRCNMSAVVQVLEKLVK